MKKWLCAVLVLLGSTSAWGGALTLSEDFDDLATSGWSSVNASVPVGMTGWFQGNAGVFSSQSGAADAYAASNFLAVQGGAQGEVSVWLISPEIDFASQMLSFFTRTADPGFDDAINVMVSTSGSSMNLADFTVLFSINPAMPLDWTQYSHLLGNIGSGRIAFQYAVGANGFADYVGIDTVRISVSQVPEPASSVLLITALLALGTARAARSRRVR